MSLRPWRTAVVVTLIVATVSAGLTGLAAGRFTWGEPEFPRAQCEALLGPVAAPAPPARIVPRYQERIALAVIREPQNTWSNLAFVFVGALVAARDRRVFSRLLGVALGGLGLASGIYHASLLPAWRTVDVATMGWVTFALGCVGATAVWPSLVARFSRLHLGIGLVGSALAIAVGVFRNDVRIAGIKPFDSTYTTIAGVTVVFVLLLVGIVFGVRLAGGSRGLWLRLGSMTAITAAAVVCQLGDHPGRWFCRPDNLIQAHAVWHVLMAAAVAVAYDTFVAIEGRDTSAGDEASNLLKDVRA